MVEAKPIKPVKKVDTVVQLEGVLLGAGLEALHRGR
jgi:hypothetical protein